MITRANICFHSALRRFTTGIFALFVSWLSAGGAAAQVDPLDAPLEVVRFGEDDTIRGLVGQYLSDPDLWPIILTLNNIASPVDLMPGMELRLPVSQVFAADSALRLSLQAIQRATVQGARIFAPVEIGSAIETRDQAVSQRVAGEWRQVVSFAGQASGLAQEALAISIAQRDRAAEAIVSDVQGTVEGRAPAQPIWSGRGMDDVLVEFERVRTLSDSTTQITFRDLSRLRLNSNSNATIQRMRSDPLTGGEVTKVSLVNGDFYALLNQLSDKTTFEIEVPGIETTTNSADFWIKSDETGARFVNFDSADLEIVRAGEAITLGENEGAVLSGQGTRTAMVLTSPLLNTPEVGQVIYTGTATLGWDAFEGGEAYWLEVALDPGFNQMQISEWGVRDTRFVAAGLAPGRYHWRVAALDALGLPGQWSTPRDFSMRVDVTPPFLTLLSPGPGSIVTTPMVDVLGVTEPDASLVLNGAAQRPGDDGSFVVSVALVKGENDITVQATDPAGNTSTRSKTVTYRPTAEVRIALSDRLVRDGDILVTRLDILSVLATSDAQAGAPVVVRDARGGVVVQTLVGPGGETAFSVTVDAARRAYSIEILGPGGAVEGRLPFGAMRDATPPAITLDLPPPRVTGEDVIQLAGTVGDAVRLTLSGTLVPLADGRFDLSVQLISGLNGFDLVATDAVGNVTLRRLETLLDIDPPELLELTLGRPNGETGPIEITVQARDASGLVQAAPFVIAVGGQEIDGFLRCDPLSGLCRATLPPQPGALELIELTVEDYAGNVAFN